MPITAVIQLASKSPRRRALLEQIGVRYRVVTATIDESAEADESPEQLVTRLAEQKARAGFSVLPELPTLGSDTIVVCDGEVFGKPSDYADSVRMLGMLSGRLHHVMSAVSICDSSRQETRLCCSEVQFRRITGDEIKRYWESGEPRDKAGSYGIQGWGAVFVARLTGSYSAVMGLPLAETAALLKVFNIPYWQKMALPITQPPHNGP